jgi:broad specificity phosphatase PhoE
MNISSLSSEQLAQSCLRSSHLAPVSALLGDNNHLAGIHHQLCVNQMTGQLFFNAPILNLQFPMMIVRHGQTDGNKHRKFQGRADGPENRLNEAGKEQARSAAEKVYMQLVHYLGLALIPFAKTGKLVILKSPSTRAQETAQIFLDYFQAQTGIGLESRVEKCLAEISFGVADGLLFEEIKDEQVRQAVLRYRLHQDATTNWNGTGESFLDVLIRAKQLLERLNDHYANREVIVIAFSHGICSSAFRTLVGETSILTDDKMIAFRNKCLENAEPHWLGQSQQIVENFISAVKNAKNREGRP